MRTHVLLPLVARPTRTGWARGLTAQTDERIARIAAGHRGIKVTRRTPPEQCRWVRGRDNSWSRGLTKATDERVRRNAEKHVGLKYSRRTPRETWRLRHSCQRLEPIDWNTKTAYAVGLIATDGNLSTSGRHVRFISADADLVETFMRCVGHRVKYRTIRRPRRRPCYEAAFSDIELYRWLQAIGLTPRKSLTLGPLDVPDEFLADVVRGLLDGDGSINTRCYCKRKRQVHRHIAVVFHSASLAHLEWLSAELHAALGVSGHRSHRVRPGRADVHLLTFASTASQQILRWVYQSAAAPRLRRKWDTWVNYCARTGIVSTAN